jgi:trimeric autotransporter adhesin
VDGEDLLNRVRVLPITTWSMIGDDQRTRHMGPVAEDFFAAFGLGLGETAIGLGDIDGVSLAGVQALERRSAELRERSERQAEEIAELRERAARQSAEIAELRRRADLHGGGVAELRDELERTRALVQTLMQRLDSQKRRN